eukprot:m.307650 g.307650  ORF g.307650 m.307650 type:complete len:397 (-) comp16463_c1_seq16:97-1287(-)
MAEEELRDFLASVTEDYGTDVTGHLDDLKNHGITKFLLNDIAHEDWAEIIKPVGPRILIRQAAGNVYLKAELKNLQGFVDRLKESRDEAITEGQRVRSELEKVQLELSRIDADLTRTDTELDTAEKKAKLAGKEVEKLNKEKDELQEKIEKTRSKILKANEEKQKALDEKENAINRAIQFGVSAQNTSTGPPGYNFNGLPPAGFAMPAPAPSAAQQPPHQQMQAPPQPAHAAPVPAQPAAVMPLEQQPWYHGGISRNECEQLLMGSRADSFVVRLSTRGDQSYSLSARESGRPNVKHFKIERAGAQWKLGLKQPDGKFFGSIVDLINHYKSVGEFSGVRLVHAALKPGAPAPAAARPMAAAPPPAAGAGGPKRCPKCGTALEGNEKFCGSCGFALK